MSDVVVDSDELLRRIMRARDWAAREEERWKERSEVQAAAYGAVRSVLDEVITPGTHDGG